MIDGRAKIKIPAGTQGGKIFRLKGKGFPAVNAYNKGDQLIQVSIWTPQNLNAEEKAMLEKLKSLPTLNHILIRVRKISLIKLRRCFLNNKRLSSPFLLHFSV